MEHTIIGNPDRGNVSFTLAAGESVIVEAGSMSFMTAGMTVKPRLIGGLLTQAEPRPLITVVDPSEGQRERLAREFGVQTLAAPAPHAQA